MIVSLARRLAALVAQWTARRVPGAEVAGSNPAERASPPPRQPASDPGPRSLEWMRDLGWLSEPVILAAARPTKADRPRAISRETAARLAVVGRAKAEDRVAAGLSFKSPARAWWKGRAA